MPKRHFSSAALRARRRLRDLTGATVAGRLGMTTAQVSKWENDKTFPPYEKFPAIAVALESDVDELFPRSGPPDLEDLRCDAGLNRLEAAQAIGVSVTPIAKAEQARKRLAQEYEEPLAAAYGVTLEELLAAQDRTFGVEHPTLAAAPSFGGAVDSALAKAFPGGTAPDDAELTRRVNKEAGRDLLAPGVLTALRSGIKRPEDVFASPADVAAFYEALGRVLGVPSLALMGDQVVAQQVLEGIALLLGRDQLALAARGAEQHGIGLDMLATLYEQMKASAAEGKGGRG